jgi:hypothetical protein
MSRFDDLPYDDLEYDYPEDFHDVPEEDDVPEVAPHTEADDICKTCDGTGEVHEHLCKDCGGKGYR